jgi:hypothetical protein
MTIACVAGPSKTSALSNSVRDLQGNKVPSFLWRGTAAPQKTGILLNRRSLTDFGDEFECEFEALQLHLELV